MKVTFQTVLVFIVVIITNKTHALTWSQESISEYSQNTHLIARAVITEAKAIDKVIDEKVFNCGSIITARVNKLYKGKLNKGDLFNFYIDSAHLKLGKEYLIFKEKNDLKNKLVNFLKHSHSMERQSEVNLNCSHLIKDYDWVAPTTISEIFSFNKTTEQTTWIEKAEYFNYPEDVKFGHIRLKLKTIEVNDKEETHVYWGDLQLPIINELKIWYDFFLWDEYEEHLISSIKNK